MATLPPPSSGINDRAEQNPWGAPTVTTLQLQVVCSWRWDVRFCPVMAVGTCLCTYLPAVSESIGSAYALPSTLQKKLAIFRHLFWFSGCGPYRVCHPRNSRYGPHARLSSDFRLTRSGGGGDGSESNINELLFD